MRGQNPYGRDGVYHAPWLFVLLIPLLWVPEALAPALPWLALLAVARRSRVMALVPIVGLSLPFVLLTWLANTDWLALFGLVGAGYAAPLFLTVKPQATGLALAAYVNPQRARYLVPLALASALALLLWRWPLVIVEQRQTITAYGHNWALWRMTWPVGLWAAWRAWAQRSVMWGCIASVLLTPYLALYSLVPALVAVTRRHPKTGCALSLASWGFAFL